MRRILQIGMALSLVLFGFTLSGLGQIISQYVETNSGTTPKGIEIWNNTGSTLDFLTNTLDILQGTNGGAPASTFTLATGTLASGAVIVIGTSDMETTTTGNGSVFYLKGFTFNGDDALVVKYGGTTTDVFGTPGSDPGSAWTGNGVSTANQNIQLKAGITAGDVVGWTDPSLRFEIVSTDPIGTGGLDGFGLAPSLGGNIPPSISNIIQSPSSVITSSSPVSVSADVTDTDGSITGVELHWGTTSGTLGTTILMSLVSGDTYTTDSDIPAQIDGTTVYYEIAATDDDSDVSTSSEQSYTVTDPATTTIPYAETFDAGFGDCYAYSVSGTTKEWYWNSGGFVAMNGFNSGDVEEDWLILPGINLDNYVDEVLSFDTYKNYGGDDVDNYFKLYYSTSYPGIGDPSGAYGWTELAFTQPANNAEWTSSGDIDLSSISGTMVYLAFQYKYASSFYRIWEVDNISIIESSSIVEPTNNPTNFTATTNSNIAISVTWTDSDADFYLIKGSDVDYASIVAPVDGTPEADGFLVQNIAAGNESFQFSGLTASTTYYFKIYGYNGAGGLVNYKTDIGLDQQDDAMTNDPPVTPVLVITEVMQNPNAVSDATGEWFEIFNPGVTPIDIDGFILSDLGTESHTISNGGPLLVPAGGFMVLGINSDILTNGGVVVDYQYSAFNLANGDDEIVITMPDGITIVDQIAYDGGAVWPDPTGKSMTLHPNKMNTIDNDFGYNWYEGITPYGSGDLGTPGAANDYPDFTSWTGAVDGNWDEAGNWFWNEVPTDIIDVTIPDVSAGKAPYPIISGSATVGSLFMAIGSTLEIASSGDLTVIGTFTNNGTLNIKSDATGTGSLIESNGVAANVERYLTPSKWHYVSSPVSSLVSDVFEGLYLMEWDETTETWTFIVDLGVTLNPTMYGYAVWADAASTVSMSGSLNAGAKSIGVTNNVDPISDNSGFNFVGNPYPSGVDWDLDNGSGWTRTNVSNSIYIWSQDDGNYGVYVKNGVGSFGVTNEIPPHQGFFVYCDDDAGPGAGSGTLAVDNAARIHTNQEILKGEKEIMDYLKFRVSGNNYSDEFIIGINNESSANYDSQFDAQKLNGSDEAPQMYSMSNDGERLTINMLPEISPNLTIPVGFKAGADAIYVLTLNEINGFDGTPIYLEDLVEHIVVDIKTVVKYKFFGSPDDIANRFVLHFSDNDAPTANDMQSGDNIMVFTSNKVVNILSSEELNGDVIVYNMLGQEVLSDKLNKSVNHEISMSGKSGYFIVNIISDRGVINKKIYLNK